MEERFLQYVRITNSNKLADRYLTVQVKEPSDLEKSHLGKILIVLEIETPDLNNYQIGQTIINALAKEYFQSNLINHLDRFEEAIKKVNQLINNLTQTTDYQWYRKFNALFALIVKDQAHLAAVGNVHAWLIRQHTMSLIFEKTERANAPAKTFNFVISGNLELGDNLVFASSGITQFINSVTLKKELSTSDSLADWSLILAKILQQNSGKWVNLITCRIDADPQNFPQSLYLDTKTLSSWSSQASSFLKLAHHQLGKLGGGLKILDNKTKSLTKSRIVPKVINLFDWLRNLIRQSISTDRWQNLLSDLRNLMEKTKNFSPKRVTRSPNQEQTQENLIGKNIYTINNYLEQNTPRVEQPSNDLPNLPDGKVNYYSQTVNMKLRDLFSKFRLRKKIDLSLTNIASGRLWRVNNLGFKLVILILFVLLIINIRAIINKQAEQKINANSAALLSQLKDKVEEAKLSRALNQMDKSLDALAFVVNKAQELKDSPFALEVKKILDDAQAELDHSTNTTRFNNLSPLAISDNAQLISLGNHRLILAGENQVAAIDDLVNPRLRSLDWSAQGAIISTTYFDKKDTLAVFSDEPKLYELNNDTTGLQAVSLSAGEWHQGIAIEQYFNNIYILSPTDNQIWKYTSQNGNLAAPTAYISDSTSVNEAIDLSIDGNIFVLFKNSQVLKFGHGTKNDLTLSDIPKPFNTLTNPKKIFVSVDNDDLYILDGQRVLLLDKNGRFKRQFAFDLESIDDFAVDEANKKIYLLGSDKLYQIEYQS